MPDLAPVLEQEPMEQAHEQKPLLRAQSRHAETLAAAARVCARIGTAAVVAVAAIDPGNLEIDIQAGATAGYRLVWAVLAASFAAWALQNASAQLALATGQPLASLCRLEYADNHVIRTALLAVAQLSVVSFDIAQVMGIAFALEMLLRWPLWFGAVVSAVDTVLILALQARGGLDAMERAVTAFLIVLAAALCYELALSKPRILDIAQGAVIPSLGPKPRQGALLAVGFLGSLVQSPNLFLHSWLVANREEDTDASDVHAARKEACVETAVVFIGAVLVNVALVAVSAAAFFPHNKSATAATSATTAATSIAATATATKVGLRDASALLQSSLGSQFASIAWAVALLCSGHAATVTSALSAQTVATGFLRNDDVAAPGALGVRAVSVVPAIIVSIRSGASGADSLIVASQVMLAFALPFASIPMIRFLDAALQIQGKGGRWFVHAAQAAFVLVALANIVGAAAGLVQDGITLQVGTIASVIGIFLLSAYSYILGVLVCRPLRITSLMDWATHPTYSGTTP